VMAPTEYAATITTGTRKNTTKKPTGAESNPAVAAQRDVRRRRRSSGAVAIPVSTSVATPDGATPP